MTTITVELPLPPSTNVMWRSVIRGGQIRIITSEAGHVFRDACAPILKDYRNPFSGKVIITCEFYFKNNLSDLDNRLKSLLDVLEVNRLGFGLYDNDRQIVAIHAYKNFDKKNPRVVVGVTELSNTKEKKS